MYQTTYIGTNSTTRKQPTGRIGENSAYSTFRAQNRQRGGRLCGENEQSDRIGSSLDAGDVSGDEDTRTPTEWRREAQGRSTKGYLDLDRRALGSDGGGAPKKVASASAAAVRSIRCPEITTRRDGAAARSVWCDRLASLVSPPSAPRLLTLTLPLLRFRLLLPPYTLLCCPCLC